MIMSQAGPTYDNMPLIDPTLNLEEKIADLVHGITFTFYPGEQKICFLNGKFRDILGYDNNEMGLQEFLDLVNVTDQEKVKRELLCSHKLGDHDKQDFECRMRHRRGTIRLFHITGTILNRSEGKAHSIIYAGEDTTCKDMEDFAFAASHDLQEPLRKISTFIANLRQKMDVSDEDALKYIDRITVTASGMKTLIDSLLDFGKLSNTNTVYEPRDLTVLMNEACMESGLLDPGCSITLENGPLPIIEVAPTQMRQLFINLFSNALKFQERNSIPEIRVTHESLSAAEKTRLELRKDLHYFKIDIHDNGIGFETEYKEKIFQPFQRLNGRREYPGSGMGLAICKKIMEHHHGLIYANSTPGEGATFTIIIPEHQ